MTRVALENNAEYIFYCQIESWTALKENLKHGRCVRLYGIPRGQYEDLETLELISVTTIEIDYWSFYKACNDPETASIILSKANDSNSQSFNPKEFWFQVILKENKKGLTCAYDTFFSEDYKRYDVSEFDRLNEINKQPTISTISELVPFPSFRDKTMHQENLTFSAFHVGQGNCSIAYGGKTGIMIDAGAGAPIRKREYKHNNIRNELSLIVDKLDRIIVILSHKDSDHWRLLSWDSALFNKVDAIYIPCGINCLAFKDTRIRSKLLPTQSVEFDSSNMRIFAHRSVPIKLNDNSECLVSVIENKNRKVLVPGDYMYSEIMTDRNVRISSLHSDRFHAVIVPHHGCEESASNIVQPNNPARAFFSAGTHAGYNHPRKNSLTEHSKIGYTNISKRTEENIIEVKLLE